MRALLFYLLLVFFTAGPLFAQYDKAARRGTAKAAKELSSMAREIRVSRQVRERLEDYARIMEYAVKHEQLNPAEQRKIQGMMTRIEKMLSNLEKNGRMSVGEAQSMQRELARAYRTLWFLRRNKLGRGHKIIFLGRQLVLREEYRERFEKGSLNQKEMQDILHTYYSACRVREQLRTDDLKEPQRRRLERACFEILSEHFTLDRSADAPAPPDREK